MFKTKQQKIIFASAMGAALLLIIITFANGPAFLIYQDNTDYKKLAAQSAAEQRAYELYLQSFKPDPEASKRLMEELVTESEVRKEVEAELDVDQPIVIPQVSEKEITQAPSAGKDAVVGYFSRIGALTQDFRGRVLGASTAVFNPNADPRVLQDARDSTERYLDNIRKTQVPKELISFHKAELLAFAHYINLLDLAKKYNAGEEKKPWPELYRNYAIINIQIKTLDSEFSRLNKQYGLDHVLPQRVAVQGNGTQMVKYAQAQFGGPTVIIGNIPQAIKEALQEALSRAFAKFITVFLEKLIAAIESNYKIANFLYYTDAVIRGQYVNDYLNKYVNNALDRQIITRFIPQFNCGQNNAELKEVFKAKARKYLGYDPAKVDPRDPLFYQKMARAGDFLASPEGWELNFREIAGKAESAALAAVNQELNSSGLKSPRDILNNQISATISAITNSQASAISAYLNLGVIHVDSFVGQLVSGILDNLFNKFLFKGAVVFKEQSSCVAVPQLQPVIPAEATKYEEPPKK